MPMTANQWMLNKFKDINFDRFNRHVDIIHQKSGKSKLHIKLSMIWNMLTMGTGYTDYFRADFINLSKSEKKTWATAKRFYKLLAYLNSEQYSIVLGDKLLFDEIFRDFLGRDFINLRTSSVDDFKKFLSDKQTVFAKDTLGECGHGISKLRVSEIEDVEKLYHQLKENGQLLVEDAIIQADDLNEINPCVVNSFRIVTLYKDGKAQVISNALRINQDDTSVIGCTNDLYFRLNEDGTIDGNVIDDYANTYDAHPMTGKRFSDVKLNGVKEAFEMCCKAAERLPQVRYIGWDVAFSQNGPVMVEGNEYPGYGILQFYALKGSRTGHLKEIADVLGDEYNKIKL